MKANRPGFLPELEDDVPVYELLSWGLCGIKARRAVARQGRPAYLPK